VYAAHVVPLGNRLLAVGEAVMESPGELPDVPTPAWVSDDGTNWTPVHSSSWDAAFSSRWPARLIAAPGGVVALGIGTDPNVAFSTDGINWTGATLPVAEHAIVEDAVGSGLGFVIVGRDGQPDKFSDAIENTPPPPGVGRPAAWISSDGLTWTEATVEGDRVAGAQLSRVVAVRSGLIAVGIESTADEGAQTLTSWFSSDGATWSIAPGLELPVGAGFYPLVAGDGDQGVVFGHDPGDSTLTAWITSDAGAWSQLTFAGTPPPTNCGEVDTCVTQLQAWVVPGGVIVMGTPGGMTPQSSWFATGS